MMSLLDPRAAVLGLAIASFAVAQEREGAVTGIGDIVPEFSPEDSDGETVRLASLRRGEEGQGKILVLTFWCTTCGSCRRIDGALDLRARELEEKGVLVFAVDSNHGDDAARVERFLEEKALGFRVLMDRGGKIARSFGAVLTTTTVVIDRDGRLRYAGGFGKAEDAVRNLLAGEEVAVAEASGFG